MADSTAPVAQDPNDVPVIWVSFCPDLGIYHLHSEVGDGDPTDDKITRDELEIMVEGLVKAGQVQQIQQLVEMCAWARLFAHKVFVFYTSGYFRVFNPIPPEEAEVVDNEFMKEFFATWQKEHPEGSNIPTVMPFRKK